MCRLILCPNPGFIQHREQHVQGADLDCFPRKEKNKFQAPVHCAQEFVKNRQYFPALGKSWFHPGLGAACPNTNFEEKHKLHALCPYSQELVKKIRQYFPALVES